MPLVQGNQMGTVTFPSGTNVTGTMNSDTFVIWVQAMQTAITSATTSIQQIVWTSWVGQTGIAINVPNITEMGTATATMGSIIWQNWNEAQQGHQTVNRTVHRAAPARTVSPEERAARAAENAAYEARIAQERKFRLEAEAKAELLLQRLLTPEQRETLKEKRCFYLHSKGKKYRIDRGQHGNVKLLDVKDQVVESYCIQPKGGLPDADAMAAQKLLLETDPEMFARVANITRRNGEFHGRAAAG